MKTIISASRRTDIPAFYWTWFQEQLKNGYVEVPNPLYPEKVSKVDLNPENVHSIVLWSKNMENVLLNPGLEDNYNLYFQYTITGYSKILEPTVPSYDTSIGILERLLTKYSPEQFNIRFDPIIISVNGEEIPNKKDPVQARIDAFERLCQDLKRLGMDNCRVTTSVLSVYNHVDEKMAKCGVDWVETDSAQDMAIMKRLAEIGEKYNRDIYTCANDRYAEAGITRIKKGHCVDGDILQSLFGKCTHSKDPSQRTECGCIKSRDIGLYTQKCFHNCAYCYVK